MGRTTLEDLVPREYPETLQIEHPEFVDVEALNVVASAGTTTNAGGGGASDED